MGDLFLALVSVVAVHLVFQPPSVPGGGAGKGAGACAGALPVLALQSVCPVTHAAALESHQLESHSSTALLWGAGPAAPLSRLWSLQCHHTLSGFLATAQYPKKLNITFYPFCSLFFHSSPNTTTIEQCQFLAQCKADVV